MEQGTPSFGPIARPHVPWGVEPSAADAGRGASPAASAGWQPGWRVGHAERMTAAETLARHCADGRLSVDELDERLARVWAAQTQAELDEPLVDLPPLPRADQPKVTLTSWLDDGRTLLTSMPRWPLRLAVAVLAIALFALFLVGSSFHAEFPHHGGDFFGH